MYYNSKDFINDLKNYNEWIERAKGQHFLLDKLNYLRYEKVKSPLDYDIVSYQGKEPVREIKHSAPPSNEQIMRVQENLDKEIKRVTNLLNRCNKVIERVNKQLELLPEEIKKACVEIYIKGRSYDAVAMELCTTKISLIRKVQKCLKTIDEQFNIST